MCSKDRSRVQARPIDLNVMDSVPQQSYATDADRIGSDVLPWVMDQNSISGLGSTTAGSSLTQ